MPNVRIVADSGCDLPASLVEQYAITIVPVFVRFGEEMISSDNLTNDEFWQRARSSPQGPGTSSPAPGTFYKVFQKLVSAGHEVVCLTLPGKHSGTYNAAWLAAQDFGEKVRVIDTGSFSLGMGLQVLVAAKEAVAGKSAELIEKAVESAREKTSIIFVLDTLEWVRRGGRLDRIIPVIDKVARTLKVKPVLEMNNGEFKLIAIARSTKTALERLENEVRERLPVAGLAAAYTRGCEAAAELADRIAALSGMHVAEVITVEAGPAFAAHAGPNAIGAAIMRA
jgi:DegV family protein with EDD domain